jgi:hypothetical protein
MKVEAQKALQKICDKNLRNVEFIRRKYFTGREVRFVQVPGEVLGHEVELVAYGFYIACRDMLDGVMDIGLIEKELGT